MSVACDYLVLGAGAQGLAFTNTLLTESRGATVVIVDKRSSPGGLWNDTYHFATLDQPSVLFQFMTDVPFPGIGTKGRRELSKRDLSQHASKPEVLTYFNKCMDHLVKHRHVRYFPSYSAEVVEEGCPNTQVRLTSTVIAAKTVDVLVGKKVVETGYGSVPVPPSLCASPFEVGAGVEIVRPHDLLAPGTAHRPMYVVIGAGKTGLDTVRWLLSRQVPAEAVCWVVPRDSWYFVAEAMEPERYHGTNMVFMRCVEAAERTEDICLKGEEAGLMCRIDTQRCPQCFHFLNMSRADLASLRAVPAIRLGRVQRVAIGRLLLERGSAKIPAGALCIDCTSNGRNRVQQVAPVFSASTIKLQRVAEFSVGPGELSAPFCAAALGLLEAVYPGDARTKNSICTPAPFPDHYNDFVQFHRLNGRLTASWSKHPRLMNFFVVHSCSRFYWMPVEHIREKNTADYKKLQLAAQANLERITPAVGFSRLLGTTSEAPAHDALSSEGASCKSELDAIKEQLALLRAEHDRVLERLLSVEAAYRWGHAVCDGGRGEAAGAEGPPEELPQDRKLRGGG